MSVTFLVLLGFFILLAIVAGALWLRHEFASLSKLALKESQESLLQLAGERFQADRQRDLGEFGRTQQQVESAVRGLQEQLKRYEDLVRTFESDREQKYGTLGAEIKRVIEETGRLEQRTGDLVSVLGNSRVRGQWGEKMAEDILRACGLQEQIHYVREKEVGSGRPDYTFLLPEEHRLFMDVKFPLDNYLRFTQTEDEAERQRYRDEFVKDVRGHIREMERREYAGQTDRALDFILIFIPNEQVFGIVNEWLPGFMDECLRKRVIVCGPWTFYAVIRIIWQAWENYHYSASIREIVHVINGFMRDYEKFRGRFEELGKRIDKVVEMHGEIATTSHQRLERRIRQIEEYRKGQQIPEALVESEFGVSHEDTKEEGVHDAPTPRAD